MDDWGLDSMDKGRDVDRMCDESSSTACFWFWVSCVPAFLPHSVRRLKLSITRHTLSYSYSKTSRDRSRP